MHSSTGSDHSSRSFETELFHVKFPDLHVSKEGPVKSWCYQLECQLFEAEDLADKDSCLMPTDVSAIVHPSQLEAFRVHVLRQLARESDRAGMVETRWDLVVQNLMRALVIKHVTKVIEAALLCAKECRRRSRPVLLQSAMHLLMATVLLRAACLNAFMHDPELRPAE
jgi:hypothetical protein